MREEVALSPLRGQEVASAGGEGRPIPKQHPCLPPTEVRNYHTWVCVCVCVCTVYLCACVLGGVILSVPLQYLGSGMVRGVGGKHSAEEACLRLKVSVGVASS